MVRHRGASVVVAFGGRLRVEFGFEVSNETLCLFNSDAGPFERYFGAGTDFVVRYRLQVVALGQKCPQLGSNSAASLVDRYNSPWTPLWVFTDLPVCSEMKACAA